ncbi:MAG: response regulator transcription factor [Winogradskyella sp.]|uniref:response regulator transcription factor n=1 Tax=Winogradskyella sp. TaxID=1883156 RepID=UPI00385D797F
MVKILLVEDDKSFGYVLSEYMKLKNYKVVWKESVSQAIDVLSNTKFDMAILDINLKQSSGFEIAKMIRGEVPNLPFVFLTARDLKIDQLKGYQFGAEEYITKPIDEEVLMAKIEAILTRSSSKNSEEKELIYKDVALDAKKRELTSNGITHNLTERENLLMRYLILEPQELVSRKLILQNLWDSEDEFSRNSMDVYISRLRKLLSKSSVVIRNVHGKGFILE